MPLALPNEPTFTVGQTLTAALMNTNVRDAVNFLLNPPICVAVQATLQTLTTGVFTPITFDTNTVDTYSGHSIVTNTSRYTAQIAGWYQVSGAAAFVANATGRRAATLAVNGTNLAYTECEFGDGSSVTSAVSNGLLFLNLADYVEFKAFQTSGGNLNTVPGSGVVMSVVWTHP